MPALSRGVAAAVVALRIQFFVTGALFATLGVHVPSIKAHYALGERSLAFALLSFGIGSVIAVLCAGNILARHSPRRVIPWLASTCMAAIASLLLPSSYAVLLALMLAYGIAAAIFDVAINDEATAIERGSGRALMSGFHGMFSVGGMAGAASWSVLADAGATPVQHLVGAAVVLGVLGCVASAFMLVQQRHGDATGSPLNLPTGPLLLVGLLAAFALVGEGAMYDWSVLYLRQEVHAEPAVASLAYASFSAAMAAGRFGGDWVRARVDAVPLLRASGALAACGMALALALPTPAAALAGFALAGLGFSNVVPVLFSAAGNVPGIAPARGIAAVSSVGYAGMMAGPPLIGFVAQETSLRIGLLAVVLFAVVVGLASGRALGATQRQRPMR